MKTVKKFALGIFSAIGITVWLILAAGGIFYLTNLISSHFYKPNSALLQQAQNSGVYTPKNTFGQVKSSLVGNIINNQLNPSKTELIQRAQKIADFTQVPEGYYVTNAVDALGFTAVVAEHPKTEQYMAIIDPSWALKIDKNDLQTGALKKKLEDYALKVIPANIQIKNFEISPRGYFTAFNQQVPYGEGHVKVYDASSRLTYEYSGIIGIVSSPESNKNELIVAVNTQGKTDQQVAERFFQKVNLQ